MQSFELPSFRSFKLSNIQLKILYKSISNQTFQLKNFDAWEIVKFSLFPVFWFFDSSEFAYFRILGFLKFPKCWTCTHFAQHRIFAFLQMPRPKSWETFDISKICCIFRILHCPASLLCELFRISSKKFRHDQKCVQLSKLKIFWKSISHFAEHVKTFKKI